MSFYPEHNPNLSWLRQAAKAEAQELAHNRAELTDLPQVRGVAVDNSNNAKDAEQIFWYEFREDGKVVVLISIINPDFIPKGGKLEALARNQMETVFDQKGNPVELMLTEEIAHDLGAFRVGQPRPAMTLELIIDLENPDAEIESRFFLSAATNVAQMSFETADKIIREDGEFAPGQKGGVFVRIADYLLAKSEGEEAVTKLNNKFARNSNGKNTPADHVVRELMSECNRQTALKGFEPIVPLLYTNFVNGLNDLIDQEASREFPSISTKRGEKAIARVTAPNRSWLDYMNLVNLCLWLRGQPPRFDTESLEAEVERINAFKADKREAQTREKLTYNIRSIERKLGYQVDEDLEDMNSTQLQDIYNQLNVMYLWRDDFWRRFRTLQYLAEEFKPDRLGELNEAKFSKMLAEDGRRLYENEKKKVYGSGLPGSKKTRNLAENKALLDFLGKGHEEAADLSNQDLHLELNKCKSIYTGLLRECSRQGIELSSSQFAELHSQPLHIRIKNLEQLLGIEK